MVHQSLGNPKVMLQIPKIAERRVPLEMLAVNTRFKDTLKQKYKHQEYPQVRKTGVYAVHESCPQKFNIGPTNPELLRSPLRVVRHSNDD